MCFEIIHGYWATVFFNDVKNSLLNSYFSVWGTIWVANFFHFWPCLSSPCLHKTSGAKEQHFFQKTKKIAFDNQIFTFGARCKCFYIYIETLAPCTKKMDLYPKKQHEILIFMYSAIYIIHHIKIWKNPYYIVEYLTNKNIFNYFFPCEFFFGIFGRFLPDFNIKNVKIFCYLLWLSELKNLY
jgi:hypothetical protein